MPRKSTKKLASDRIVYEVMTPQHGTRQVEAESTKELKGALTPLLPLDPYSVQAIAHLAQTENAIIQGADWAIRRIGKRAFIPDEVPAPVTPRKKSQGKAQETKSGAPSAQNTVNPAQGSGSLGIEDASPPEAKEGGSDRLSFGEASPAPRQTAATAGVPSTSEPML